MIARRLENLVAFDYSAERLELAIASGASSGRTEEIAAGFPGVRGTRNPRRGKLAPQDNAVRSTESEIVAFAQANALVLGAPPNSPPL